MVAAAAVEPWTARDTAAAGGRELVFKWKRRGEITPISESPPTPAVPLESPSQVVNNVDEERDAPVAAEIRTGLKFKFKLPVAH
jgi:hypothetical protein